MEDTNETCPVCFLEIKQYGFCVTNCSHTFCMDCMFKCIKTSNDSCPLCRKELCSTPINYDPLANIDDGSCIYTPIPTINDSLAGLWHLTHYDTGSGLESADSGQYIHFLPPLYLSFLQN